MMPAGSAGSRPSPAARVSQSPQARGRGSAGSAGGRAAPNLSAKWAALGSPAGSPGPAREGGAAVGDRGGGAVRRGGRRGVAAPPRGEGGPGVGEQVRARSELADSRRRG